MQFIRNNAKNALLLWNTSCEEHEKEWAKNKRKCKRDQTDPSLTNLGRQFISSRKACSCLIFQMPPFDTMCSILHLAHEVWCIRSLSRGEHLSFGCPAVSNCLALDAFSKDTTCVYWIRYPVGWTDYPPSLTQLKVSSFDSQFKRAKEECSNILLLTQLI